MTRELLGIGVYNAVPEGNFFSVIQWSLEKNTLSLETSGFGGGARHFTIVGCLL